MDCDKSANQEETPPVFTLPTEMLQEVFNRVPFRDLLKCREVHSTWKRAATVPLRKRCAPFDFTRKEILKKDRCSRVVQSFLELIRVANEQGGLNEFPVAKFSLELHQNYYWIEVDGRILICQLLEAVSNFVKEIVFNLQRESCQLPNNSIAIYEELTFENLTEITLKVSSLETEPCGNGIIFSFIRNIIEKCPNVKEFHLELVFYEPTRSDDTIRRCITETGIQRKASKVTSLNMSYAIINSDLEYFSNLGFKLKDFVVDPRRHDVNPEIWKKFLESQSDTLTSLTLADGNSDHFIKLPCLPRLKKLFIYNFQNFEDQLQLPTLFYKEQLPALKTLDLENVAVETHYFMGSHLAPTDSLRELILPVAKIINAGQAIRQVARIFPNLEKLQVFNFYSHDYMSDIYVALPGIKELCISSLGGLDHSTVDDIITGLPKQIMRKIKCNIGNLHPPNYYWSKALAMLEGGTTKSLACLENLKTLEICRRLGIIDTSENNVGEADFSELSGVVLKQMKALERIDFGMRAYGPILKLTLQEDIEAHGIQLSYRLPPHKRFRTDFVGLRL